MSLTDRLDRFQRTHSFVGYPIAVAYKLVDDQGGQLAALLAYYAFLSLFPMMLLLVTVLGYLLAGDQHLQSQILSSTLAQLPIIGDQLRANVRSLHGSATALTIGIIGSLYGGIGVAQAGQNAMNVAWSVPRNSRLNPLKSRLLSLVAVLVLGASAVGTTALSSTVSTDRDLAKGMAVLALLLAVLGNAAVFLGAFRLLTPRSIAFRVLVPGALVASLLWLGLQTLGTFLLGHSFQHATQVYGLFGLVLGLLGFLYLAALLTMICVEANVVREQRLWPRALLTPFTDDVDLTAADEESYTSLAQTQRAKDFESIDVSFDPHR